MGITLSIVAGSLMIPLGAWSCWRVRHDHAAHAQKLAKCLIVEGKVTHNRREVHSDSNQSMQGDSEGFTPVVEYTVKGIRYMTPVYTGHGNEVPIGTSMKIACNPALPSDTMRIEPSGAYAMYTSAVILLAGVVLLVLALGFDVHLLN